MINELFLVFLDKKNNIDLSTVISIFSLILSGIVFWMSNRQFVLSNQGYLDIVPNLNLTIPDNNSLIAKPSITDQTKVEGLTFSVLLKNVGNLPFLYDVLQYSTFINNIENKMEDGSNTQGILYPKQELTFHLKTLPLNSDGTSINFGKLKLIPIHCLLEIQYHDLKGYKHNKYIKREFKWEIHDNVAKYNYTLFGDTL